MKAIINAVGESNKLAPLTRALPAAMLPVANRPVMSYTIELLARQGIKEILVSLHDKPEVIERYFESGKRWGVRLTYVLQRDRLGSAGALKWAQNGLQEDFIAIPGDVIVDFDINDAYKFHKNQSSVATVIVSCAKEGTALQQSLDDMPDKLDNFRSGQIGFNTGLCIFDRQVLDQIPSRSEYDIYEDFLPDLLECGQRVSYYEINSYWNSLESFQSYQNAQRLLMANSSKEERHGQMNLRFISIPDRQLEEGIWIGRNSSLHPTVRVQPPVLIGSNFLSGENVEIGPNVVVGDNVVVDGSASIRESVILDRTYIGKYVHIENRIVNQDMVIDIDTTEFLQVTDPFLLSNTSPEITSSGFGRVFEYMLAMLLLLITLPFTILIGFLVFLQSGKVLTTSERVHIRRENSVEGNHIHQSIYLYRFATRRKNGDRFRLGGLLERLELDRLPELVNLFKGDLALVGVKPLTHSEMNLIAEQWQHILFEAKPGISGLWYTQTSPNSSLDDIFFTDVYYNATRSWKGDLRIFLQTPVAWVRKMRNNYKSGETFGELRWI